MQIVMIGTGNVATVMSKKLRHAGHRIVQVYGRRLTAAKELADTIDATPCDQWNQLTQDADLYIVAVSDSALAGNSLPLQPVRQLMVHTAGAVSKEILKPFAKEYGVLYPYQSIRKETIALPEIPFFIDASSTAAMQVLSAVAGSISTQVSVANDEQRVMYHVCAVMTNNFSNYLFTLAENFCKKNGLDFSNLLPLINETAQRLAYTSPATVQTGPAIRHDGATIERHLQLLKNEPAMSALYHLFTQQILAYPWPTAL